LSAYKIQKMGDVICGHLFLEILKRLDYERFHSILLDRYKNGYLKFNNLIFFIEWQVLISMQII
jgi:hypothetical protein